MSSLLTALLIVPFLLESGSPGMEWYMISALLGTQSKPAGRISLMRLYRRFEKFR